MAVLRPLELQLADPGDERAAVVAAAAAEPRCRPLAPSRRPAPRPFSASSSSRSTTAQWPQEVLVLTSSAFLRPRRSKLASV